MKKNKSEEIRYEATVIAPIGVPIVNGQTMKANEVIKVLQKKYTASKVYIDKGIYYFRFPLLK